MEVFKYNVVMPRFKARSSTHMIVVFEITLLCVNGQIRFKNAICGLCGSRKYPYPPHGGSRKFRGVGGSENDKFPKGRGVTQTGFFTGGLK